MFVVDFPPDSGTGMEAANFSWGFLLFGFCFERLVGWRGWMTAHTRFQVTSSAAHFIERAELLTDTTVHLVTWRKIPEGVVES